MKMKSMAIAMAVLSVCILGFPFHKFYLNKPGEAMLRIVLMFFGISIVIAIFDLLHLLGMSESEFNYLYNNGPAPVYTMQAPAMTQNTNANTNANTNSQTTTQTQVIQIVMPSTQTPDTKTETKKEEKKEETPKE